MQNNCPTNEYNKGVPNGKCWGNGHYLCKTCKHQHPKFIDREFFHKVISEQGFIKISTLK